MLRVLVVDDEPLIIEILRKTIPWQDYGMEIVGYTQNGEQAMEYLENHEVDIIIVDMKMPRMNGLDLIKTLHCLQSKTRFVVLSSYSDFHLVRQSFKYGVFDYLLKIDIDNPKVTQPLFSNLRESIHKETQENQQEELLEKIQRDSGKLQAIGDEILIEDLATAVEDYIQENFSDTELSMATLAENLRFPKRTIRQHLYEKTGLYFREYLNNVRLEKAAFLLGNTKLRVREVATLVGYVNVEHFSRIFSTRYGVPPSQYTSKGQENLAEG